MDRIASMNYPNALEPSHVRQTASRRDRKTPVIRHPRDTENHEAASDPPFAQFNFSRRSVRQFRDEDRRF